jgi:rhomboid protease GluP
MMHIVMNMLSLYMVGTMVERLFSPMAYLSIYFTAGLVGSFASMYIHTTGWAVGASGAIFGIFGALAGFAWIYRQTMREQFMHFMKNFGVILLINLGIGLVFPSIDMSAHVGGLIAGLVGGMMIATNPRYLWAYLFVTALLLYGMYNVLVSLN